jgi:hypothetical protein
MHRGVCAVAAALFALCAGAAPAGPPLADYPQAHWLAASSSNYTAANRPLSGPINMVVIHVTDGSYAGTLQWFRNRVDAKVGIEQWRRHYNEVRPHSSLGYLTPAEFKATLAATITEGGSAAAPPRPVQEDQRPNQSITLTGAVLQ